MLCGVEAVIAAISWCQKLLLLSGHVQGSVYGSRESVCVQPGGRQDQPGCMHHTQRECYLTVWGIRKKEWCVCPFCRLESTWTRTPCSSYKTSFWTSAWPLPLSACRLLQVCHPTVAGWVGCWVCLMQVLLWAVPCAGLCQEVPAGKGSAGTLYIKTFTLSPDVPVRVDYVAKHIDMDKVSIGGWLVSSASLSLVSPV